MQKETDRSHKKMSKGEETKQNIIEKAAAMFNQLGYEGASLAHLMEATGLQKGGIYRHFTSKEELAAEAFDYAWKSAREARLKDIDSGASAIQQLRQIVANFVARRPPVPGGCPLLNTAVDSDDGNSVLRARAHRALSDWKSHLAAIVRRGMENDQIRGDVNPGAVATFIVAALEGGLMMSRLEGDAGSLKTVETYLSGFLDSLALQTPATYNIPGER
ncbi:MAG: TetR/AcrR family transcriptional regulator, transcriptional repressor for nem operon [Bryobacterales bacterium]|nr:TetR/AcrR family transcriptional regulator, transcriptional repressor for nem operon [Bryobacterales bacterium]